MGCLSVAARLLGLVEVVLDAQVILHGGLVLEEPLTELAGNATHGPVLVPRKNLVSCHLFPMSGSGQIGIILADPDPFF